MAVLCIDVGSSMIKAVAFDDRGRELALARQETAVRRPRPGFAEQDMDEVWNAVVFTARTAARQLHEGVELLAFTAQGDGCWLIDGAGRPTGPAIVWNDARGRAIVERWRRAGTLEAAFRVNGSLGFAGLPHAILAWLHEQDPDRLERSHAALTCGGWVFAKLTGEVAVDESDASVPFMDIRARRYSSELLALYELEWAERLLPEIRGDDRRTASLRPEAATELGLRAGLPVVMAPYDVAACAIGVGAVRPGHACSILGTTLCTEVVVDEPSDETPAGLTIAAPDGRWLRAFPTLAGGEVVVWAVRQLGLRDPGELSQLADRVEPGAGGLRVLPYLSPAGERAPFLAPEARGMVLGLSLEHEREHLCRAVLEGLTFVVRDCLRASDSTPSEPQLCGLCGGGARSAVWCQLIADAIGVPTFRVLDTEVGAKGAFVVGLVATGSQADHATAAERFARRRDTFEPDADRHACYEELYEEFLELRELAAPQWRRLAAVRDLSPPVEAAP